MPTISRKAFDKNIGRAAHFLSIHAKGQAGAGAPPLAYRELPRASVVFAIGAIDAYLSEVCAEVLVAQLQTAPATQGQELILKQVQSTLPTLPIELCLMPTRGARIVRLQESIANHFHNSVSNHGSKAVSNCLTLIGCKPTDLWSVLEQRGHSRPQTHLDDWTNTRHQIVHQGRSSRVRRIQAKVLIDFAQALVARFDDLATKAKT
jgi:hypothetical protein